MITETKFYRIPEHEFANAKIAIEKRVIYGEETYITAVRLISYSTDIMGVKLVEGGIYELYINGLFSMTTRKHISWFLRLYPGTLTYHEVKMYFEDKLLRSDGTRNASIAEIEQMLKIADIIERVGKQIR